MSERVSKRIIWFLAALLLLSLVLPVASAYGAASDATATGSDIKREIAVVYDNSGSMYVSFGVYRWCRSVYACEMFAAMMNEGDELLVFPMNPVLANGQQYSQDNPLVIHVGDEAILSSMVTVTGSAGNTPVESLEKAYKGLLKTTADEKWLVMLTDGDVFYEDGQPHSGTGTRDLLSRKLTEYNNKVNVMYVGVDCSDSLLPQINGSMESYSVSAQAETLLKTLAGLANKVFDRFELETDGKTIEFDIPMKKMIVFSQGENLNMVKVDGLGTRIRQYYPQYSVNEMEISEPFSEEAPYWTIITYVECAPGKYQLEHSGTLLTYSVFFEPDMEVISQVTGTGGGEIVATMDKKSGAYPSTVFSTGKYTGKTDEADKFEAQYVAWASDNPGYGSGNAAGGIDGLDSPSGDKGKASGGLDSLLNPSGLENLLGDEPDEGEFGEEDMEETFLPPLTNPENYRVNNLDSKKNGPAEKPAGSEDFEDDDDYGEIYKKATTGPYGGGGLPSWFQALLYIPIILLALLFVVVIVARIAGSRKKK